MFNLSESEGTATYIPGMHRVNDALNSLQGLSTAAISTAISTEVVNRNLAITAAVSTAISTEIVNRDLAISTAISTALL